MKPSRTSKEIELANELAETLDDRKSYNQFLAFAKNYPESFLREQLRTVMATPQRKITNNRASYFVFLVNLNG